MQKKVAVGLNNGCVQLLTDGIIHECHSKGVKTLIWLDNARLLTGSYDHLIRLWSFFDGQFVLQQTLHFHRDGVWDLQRDTSQSGTSWIASAGLD